MISSAAATWGTWPRVSPCADVSLCSTEQADLLPVPDPRGYRGAAGELHGARCVAVTLGLVLLSSDLTRTGQDAVRSAPGRAERCSLRPRFSGPSAAGGWGLGGCRLPPACSRLAPPGPSVCGRDETLPTPDTPRVVAVALRQGSQGSLFPGRADAERASR